MVDTVQQHYCYAIDEQDRLTHLSDDWLSFAAENNAAELTESSLLGHSLWEYIEGQDTILLYKKLFERVRETQQQQCLPFRCDAPIFERHMRMNIVPQPSGSIHFDCVIVKVRIVPAVHLLEPTQRRSADCLHMCSFCKRVEVPPLGWLEVAEVVGRMHLFRAEQMPKVQQTVCPLCRERAESL